MAASPITIILGKQDLTSVVCLINSSIDASPTLSVLLTSLHSTFTFSWANDWIIAFHAAEFYTLLSTAEISLCKKSGKISFGPFMI